MIDGKFSIYQHCYTLKMNKSESIDNQIIELIEKAIKLHYERSNDSCKKIGELSEIIAKLSEEIDQWENIRVHLPGSPHQGGEFYGKVVRVTTLDTTWEALVKITSLSPAAQKVFSPA